MSARERALERAAEAAGGADPAVSPPKGAKAQSGRYVVASAIVRIEPGDPEETYAIVFDTETGNIERTYTPAAIVEAQADAVELNRADKARKARLAEPQSNKLASRGSLVHIGKRLAIVTEVRALDAGWGYVAHWLKENGTRLGEPTYTTALEPLEAFGRWTGNFLREGSVGTTITYEQPTNNPKEADMATKVVTKKGKKGNKPAAKKAASNGGTARRTKEDVDALVPEFVEHLTNGGKMKDLKSEYGFSDDGPIRAALYRNGYDAKGEEHEEEAESINAGNAKGKKEVVKLRDTEAAPWYRLAFLTGLSEPEVKKIVADGGGTVSGRVYKDTAPKPKAAKKPAAKKAAGKKGGKATKADPS